MVTKRHWMSRFHSKAMKDGFIAGFGAPSLFFQPPFPSHSHKVTVDDAWLLVGQHIKEAVRVEGAGSGKERSLITETRVRERERRTAA